MGNTKIPKTPDANRVKRLRFSPSDYPYFFFLLRRSWKSALELCRIEIIFAPSKKRGAPPSRGSSSQRPRRKKLSFFSCGEKGMAEDETSSSLFSLHRPRLLQMATYGTIGSLRRRSGTLHIRPPGGAPGQRKKKEERLNFVPSFPRYLHHGRKSLLFCFPPLKEIPIIQ